MKADTVGQPCASASKISAASNRVIAGAADVVADIDAADAEARRLAHHVDRKMLLLVPAHRMRRDFLRGEFPRHIANRNLVLVESELHVAALSDTVSRLSGSAGSICAGQPGMTMRTQFIVGIENSAPSLTPEGQRAVTVLVLV